MFDFEKAELQLKAASFTTEPEAFKLISTMLQRNQQLKNQGARYFAKDHPCPCGSGLNYEKCCSYEQNYLGVNITLSLLSSSCPPKFARVRIASLAGC